MPNTILTPTAVTREALRILHQKLNFVGSITREYDDSFAKSGAKIGDSLKIRLPNQYTVRTGATLWKYFTQTALRSSPFAAGDVVLQDVPGEGLVALTQNPEAQPGGEVRWRRAHVAGSPIGVLDGAAMFWCPVGHVVTLVDLKKGDIVRTVSLPSVTSIEADTIEAGGFIAWSSDGRVERLAPMNPPAAAAAPAVATK